jgi:thiol-disulfide isomerase/thioredoxin
MGRRRVLCFVISSLFLGLAGNGRTEDSPKTAPVKVKHLLEVGDDAPKLAALEFVKGEAVDGFEKGKIYVIEFWHTHCIPCLGKVGRLTKLQRKYKKDVVLIAVTSEEPALIKRFVKKWDKAMDYRVAIDSDDEEMHWRWLWAAGLNGIPMSFIVDGNNGKIAWIGGSSEETIEKIRSGKWDLKAAAAKYAADSKDARETIRAREEAVQRQIAQLPEAERVAAQAVRKLGGKVRLNGASVKNVGFRDTKLTDTQLKELLKELKELKTLRQLSFVGCDQVTDEGLNELLKEPKNLQDLQELSLGGTGATDAVLKDLKQLKGLQKLVLSHMKVTDGGLKELKELKDLQELVIINTKVTDKGVEDLKKALPKLQISR